MNVSKLSWHWCAVDVIGLIVDVDIIYISRYLRSLIS
jgi:hypothetical protein